MRWNLWLAPKVTAFKLVVTTAQHGGPGTPHGQPSSTQPPGDPFVPPAAPPGPQAPAGFPAPPAASPGSDWRYAPPPPRRGKGVAIAVAAAILLATAALVVGIVDLTRSSTRAAPAASTPTTPAPTSAPTDFTGANRALCTIAPLMTEDNRVAKTFSNLGPAGSQGWDAGKDKFVSDTKDWVGRIQPVIDSHPNVDPYFRRSLQRFVDDQRIQSPTSRPARGNRMTRRSGTTAWALAAVR